MKILTEVEKAALDWAKQRAKYLCAASLGKANARAALQRKADKLSYLVLELDSEKGVK